LTENSALLCLHQNQTSADSVCEKANTACSRSTSAADSSSRMLLEAVTISGEQPKLDWDTMPCWTLTSLHIAAMVRIRLSSGDQDRTHLVEEVQPARVYLQHFERRWKIAGRQHFQ
jgi:hypothetical protein